MKSFINYLLESKNSKRKIIAVYPGRFQLPHKGHKFVYDWLDKHFSETYIATSNKIELPKSPFGFNDKVKLLSFLGIDKSKIVQTRSPNNPEEITRGMSEDTILVIAAGAKVQDEENRYSFKPKKDGSPGYFQPYEENKNNLKGYKEHAYIVLVPTHTFHVLGKEAKSASEMRKQFVNLDEDGQRNFIKDLYGKYSLAIHKLLKSKLEPLKDHY